MTIKESQASNLHRNENLPTRRKELFTHFQLEYVKLENVYTFPCHVVYKKD